MSILEANVSIIFACGPALLLLVRRLFPGGDTDQSVSAHELHSGPTAPKPFRGTTSSMKPHTEIVKTSLQTISMQAKGSEYAIELVGKETESISTGNGVHAEGTSFAVTHSTDSYKDLR
jgi:hypothetical protein